MSRLKLNSLQTHRTVPRTGLTVLELLVTVSIIGVLMALLLPAIGAARESTRRVQCVSHLREVGIALHNHHDAKRSLPAGWTFDAAGKSAYGWTVKLLPFLEQHALVEQIDLNKSVNDPLHQLARGTSLAVMLCPSDISEPTFMLFEEDEEDDDEESGDLVAQAMWSGTRSSAARSVSGSKPAELGTLPTANYIGVFGTIEPDDDIPAPIGDGPFLENRVTRFRDFSRGLSHTFVVGERTMAQIPSTWLGVSLLGEDAAARIVGSALEGINNPIADECDFSSRHPGGANFLWGDGHVSFVTQSVDLYQYHQWSQLRTNSSH